MKKLEFLSIDGTPTSDAGLKTIGGLKSLKQLHLNARQNGDASEPESRRPRITDAGMAHLTGLDLLEELRLDGTRVSDAGLALLPDLPDLTFLSLGNTGVTAAVQLGPWNQAHSHWTGHLSSHRSSLIPSGRA